MTGVSRDYSQPGPAMTAADLLYLHQHGDELATLNAQLDKRFADLDARIRLAGEADQIVALRDSADQMNTQARQERAKAVTAAETAKTGADQIIAEANREAAAIKAKATAELDQREKDLAAAEHAHLAKVEENNARSADLDARDAKLAEDVKAMHAIVNDAGKAHRLYTDKLNTLRQAVAGAL